MEVEQTCRICRGEATARQPLIHPCKCRGSIKYIHQECLMEWLQHSNNDVKQCDICNTRYQFRTIYDPDMPTRVPLREIWPRLVAQTAQWVVRHLSVLLYVVCGIQVPIFWKFIGRIFTFAVDGKIPSPSFNIADALYYGASTMKQPQGAAFKVSTASVYEKAEFFVFHTVLNGLIYVIGFVFVLFIVFIEHEWVVREEGYTKLLLRKIGKEPRTKLADLLALLAQLGDADQNDTINRALEDLRNMPDLQVNENVLRRALEHGQHADLIQTQHRVHRRAEPHEIDLVQQAVPDEDDNATESDNGEFREDFAQRILDIPLPALEEAETAEELERRRNLAEDEMAAVEAANNNGDILELLGFRFNLTTPIQLMLLADFIILVFLFNAYLIPHMLGKFAAMTAMFVFLGVRGLLVNYTLSILPSGVVAFLSSCLRFVANVPPPFSTHASVIYEEVTKPFTEFIDNITTVERLTQPTFCERLTLLSIGYFIICSAINQFMNSLIAGKKPVMGTPRKIYKAMFQAASTAKVFAIFAIEIFFFPVYCGWLLDFCLAPLIAPNSTPVDDARTSYTLLLTSAHEFTQRPYYRFLLYWLGGTCYMYFVALFVGMIRNHILRPGVLYFIKSPEDPNARLIHDAVVKPFFLQILRILLSAKVYTAFVVLGIGSITWGLRFLVNPPGGPGALLPMKAPALLSLIYLALVIWRLVEYRDLIARYSQKFWKRAFINLCYKFRLSHFILGTPIAQERGHIVYRNGFYKLFGIGNPDYSKPVSHSEAMELFRNDPSITACFIPDGYYVRAPSSDDNSRKFLRGLFVPVTKSDKPIEPVDDLPDEEDTDWWDADIVYEDSYTVVYRPPNIKARCLGLVCMICIIGALLIVGLALGAAVSGRLMFRAFIVLQDIAAKALKFKVMPSSEFNWAFLDFQSLSFGCIGILKLMEIRERPNEPLVHNVAALAPERRFLAAIRPKLASITMKFLLFVIRSNYFTIIHSLIAKVERHYFGVSFTDVDFKNADVFKNWPGLFLHVVFLPWTFIPMITAIITQVVNDESFVEFARRMGLDTLGNFGVLALYWIFLFAAPKNRELLGPDAEIQVVVLTLAVTLLTRLALSSFLSLAKINNQIKNEKYVRGTAIENAYGADEDL